jgi:hypothetical protein
MEFSEPKHFGDLAAGGISNLYTPQRDRHGDGLTFENAGLALGSTAAAIRAVALLQVLTARVRRSSESLISWQRGELD